MSRKPASLRPKARKLAISELVSRRGKVTVDELADKFGASPETVRRDLSALADAGQVRKIHGGAIKITPTEEGAFSERLRKNTLAKQLVAEKLVKTVVPGQSLLIDTGSTTLICAETLARVRDLTVITNSTQIASVFSERGNGTNAILLGGRYRHDNAQTVGPTTIAEMGRYRTDLAILTIGTLDVRGASDFSEEEAQVARAMIEASEHVTVVADTTKLNKRSTFHVCGLEQIDRLILENAPDKRLQEALDAAGVEVL